MLQVLKKKKRRKAVDYDIYLGEALLPLLAQGLEALGRYVRLCGKIPIYRDIDEVTLMFTHECEHPCLLCSLFLHASLYICAVNIVCVYMFLCSERSNADAWTPKMFHDVV